MNAKDQKPGGDQRAGGQIDSPRTESGLSLKKAWRRLRTLLWTALALVVIFAAVIVGIGKLLLPYSDRYKPQLEALLSEQFNQPVQVESFTGEWMPFGPRISLQGVKLLGAQSSDQPFAIDEAALDVRPLNALLTGRPLYSFRVIRAHVTLSRGAEGRFELSGLGVNRRTSDPDTPAPDAGGVRTLAELGEIRLQDSSFSYTDAVRNIQVHLVAVNGRMQMIDDILAVEVQASVAALNPQRILGDLSVSAQAVVTEEQQIGEVRWHLETGELSASDVARGLPDHALAPESGWLNAELWGNWAPQQPIRMDGVVDIRDAVLNDNGQALVIDHLNARTRWRSTRRDQWRLDLVDARFTEGGREWSSPRITVERNIPGGIASWVSADRIEAEFPLRLTQMIMRNFNAKWPESAPLAGRGLVTDFDLVINEEKNLAMVRGEFEGIDVLDWGKWPLVSGLNGRVDLSFGEGSLWFSSPGADISWPRNFLSDTRVVVPECELEILWEGREWWQMDALDCELSNDWIELRARTRFAKDEGKPQADLNIHVSRADLSKVGDFWPRSVMSPKVTDWLARSVRSGQITEGQLHLQGDLDDFPFANRQGSLVAEFMVENADLLYNPQWPVARGVNALARFEGPAMSLRGGIEDLAGNRVKDATALIADIKRPLLTIDYISDASLSGLQAFLEASPMLDNSDVRVDDFEFAGRSTVLGRLTLPFGDTPGELGVDGVLELSEASFNDLRSGFMLDSIAGPVEYSRDGLLAEALPAAFLGWPAQLDLSAAWSGRERLNARLSGAFPIESLLAESPLADEPSLQNLQGVSVWTGELSVIREEESDSSSDIRLRLESDLLGTAINLPVPLSKPADEQWPVSLDLPLVLAADSPARMRVSLPGRMTLDLSSPAPLTPPTSGALALGTATQALPPEGLFAVNGEVDEFDLDGWGELVIQRAGQAAELGTMQLDKFALRTDRLFFTNRQFDDVALSLSEDGLDLTMIFDGADIAGEVRYTRNPDGSDSVTAQMERLLMPEPLSAGKPVDTDPTVLPELHFYVEQFRFAGLDFGETRVEAFPVANGLRFDSINALSTDVTVEARGDWIATDEGTRSDFDIMLTSESLGTLVDALNISSVLEGGQTLIHYDAWWSGAPTEFELARLNGNMTFSVIDGRVLNAEPGAGRMLGLMSVAALPRRLSLDFSDVFQSGFSFDQASGTVDLQQGVAMTNDFVMESTAASLAIQGSSDLVGQQYDYVMTVRPGVSQALPVLGALTAGPVGAAAGLALQGLLRDALGDAAEARYIIKGPWDAPDVVRSDPVSPAGNQQAVPDVNGTLDDLPEQTTEQSGVDDDSSTTKMEARYE